MLDSNPQLSLHQVTSKCLFNKRGLKSRLATSRKRKAVSEDDTEDENIEADESRRNVRALSAPELRLEGTESPLAAIHSLCTGFESFSDESDVFWNKWEAENKEDNVRKKAVPKPFLDSNFFASVFERWGRHHLLHVDTRRFDA